jgi:uncharacterized membrane protein YjgN (DUF898 family)
MENFGATAPAAPAGPAAPASASARFVGNRRTYWWLIIRGTALMVVTLGIYRFWLTTDMRRFLWANTEVAGQTLEYTGTARELLIGFLFAITILLPIYASGFIIALMLGPIGQAAAPLLGLVGVSLFGPFAVYRARRYRLTRTIYRGVRFQQTGSALLYALISALWWVAIILTLGLAYPLALSSLERFKMRHTSLGNLAGGFDGSAFRLLLRGFLMWLVVVGPLILGMVAIATAHIDWAALARASTSGGNLRNLISPEQLVAIGAAMSTLLWSPIVAFFLYPVFQAMVWRWWAAGLRFGDVRVASNLRIGQVYGIYLRFLGYILLALLAIVVIFLLLVAVVGLLVYVVMTQTGSAMPDIFGESTASAVMGAGVVFLAYVAMVVGFAAVYQVIVKLGFWRCVVDSLQISNVATLTSVRAVGGPSSAIGEGLADALNVGGI